MVSMTEYNEFDRIVDILSPAALARMDGTRWRDDLGIEVENPRLMAKRLHAHGFIPNIDRILMVAPGSNFAAGDIIFTRLA